MCIDRYGDYYVCGHSRMFRSREYCDRVLNGHVVICGHIFNSLRHIYDRKCRRCRLDDEYELEEMEAELQREEAHQAAKPSEKY
jgi:hypothetical protein